MCLTGWTVTVVEMCPQALTQLLWLFNTVFESNLSSHNSNFNKSSDTLDRSPPIFCVFFHNHYVAECHDEVVCAPYA